MAAVTQTTGVAAATTILAPLASSVVSTAIAASPLSTGIAGSPNGAQSTAILASSRAATAVGTGYVPTFVTGTATGAVSTAISLTTGAPGLINTFPGDYTTTALRSTQTAIPTERRPYGCGTGFMNVPSVHPACAMLASNETAAVMLQCCNGAERVVYASNCNIYCDAQGQTLQQLSRCLSNTNIGNRTIGQGPNDLGGVLCNRGGASYSELLPEETDSRSFGQPTGTSTSTSSSRSSAGTGVAQVTTAAAARGPNLNALGPDSKTGLSLAGWGTVAVLFMSGFAGFLV